MSFRTYRPTPPPTPTGVPPWSYWNPCPPKNPKRFRRGARVVLNEPHTIGQKHSRHGNLGTVLNPERDTNHMTGERFVTVRWDSQHPWEKGRYCAEDQLEPDVSGDNQFEKRRYDLMYLSHDEIALMRDITEGDMRPEAAELLKKLPKLPK